ncbi:MAG: alpha/beta hydrolase [Myxococcota bacterium]
MFIATVILGCDDGSSADDTRSDAGAEPDGADEPAAPAEPPVGFTNQFATVNGIQMHYVMGGSGDAVVLLHGWPQTWYEWHRIMPALAEGYTVIAPDLRGGGDSDKPPSESGYSKRQLAEDIHALIGELGLDRVIVVGHDIGLMVAYAYAFSYPDEVRALVLLDAPLPGIEPFWTEILKDPRSWHFGFHAETELAASLIAGQEREYLTSFFAKFAGRANAFTEAEITEFSRAYAAPGALVGGFEWYHAFDQDAIDNAAAQADKLTMPVLALGGEFSFGPFIVAMASEVAEDVRGGSIAGAGHWLTEEQPEALTAELLDFFAEVTALD